MNYKNNIIIDYSFELFSFTTSLLQANDVIIMKYDFS